MLRGRITIITGAGRGIGASAAKLFGREGARLVINDLDSGEAQSCADAINAAGGEAIALGGSIIEPSTAKALVESAMDQYGACPDVIVNNAGFLWDGMLHKTDDAQWNAILDCHLTAPFRLLREAAPHIRSAARAEIEEHGAARDRAIVNVSSTTGLHGAVGQANYAAAKAGILGLTKTVAKEWGPLGVRANAVAFGMIDTRMTNAFTEDASNAVTVGGEKIPQGVPEHVAKMWSSDQFVKLAVPLARKGTSDEAAGGMLFRASPLASYITGHTLEVTGGMGI